MKIAFDWQGTLDTHGSLRDMAWSLQKAGWEVLIISAMPINMPGVREAEIAASISLPYKVVYHELENYHQAAGAAKIKLMKELEITLLVDDTEGVVKAVREAGLEVLQI